MNRKDCRKQGFPKDIEKMGGVMEIILKMVG